MIFLATFKRMLIYDLSFLQMSLLAVQTNNKKKFWKFSPSSHVYFFMEIRICTYYNVFSNTVIVVNFEGTKHSRNENTCSHRMCANKQNIFSFNFLPYFFPIFSSLYFIYLVIYFCANHFSHPEIQTWLRPNITFCRKLSWTLSVAKSTRQWILWIFQQTCLYTVLMYGSTK